MEGISNKDMTAVEGAFGYYQVSVDDSQTKVKFLRMNGDKSQQWNATAELTIPTDGNDCYTITDWGENDGNWSKYTAPDPIDPSSIVYSIKHPWKDGADASWSYKDLTPNGDGTYSIRDIYGGKGCNWKSTVSGEKWVGTPTLVGEPAVGDSAIFTLTSTEGDGAITITKIASTGGEGGGTDPDVPTLPKIQLMGTLTNWDNGTEMTPSTDNLTAEISLELTAETTYKLKIKKDGAWLGNNGTMTSDNCSGWTFTSSEGDCGLTTTIAGYYTFKWEYATDKLTVTYPSSTTTALTNTEAENATVKVIRNGQVLIVREGVTYNMMGQVIQ
ncbi:MAG: hypothetical protein SPD96_02300 [Paludibacteraceae bacterium]|nr:hypothetical protein [Paludibacteraceae bacterium]